MDAGDRKIYVARENEEDYRLFSAQTARGYLRTGLIQENDLAWCEGMTDWQPLVRVLETVERTSTRKTPSLTTITPLPGSSKVSVTKLAETCFQLALSFQDAYTNVIRDLQASKDEADEELDYGQVWVELVYLGCVVVDHAIEASLNEETREVILKLYRSHLYRVKIEGIHSFRPIKTRLLLYGQEAHTSRSDVSNERIGQKFAHFCGSKYNRKLIKIGATLFHNVYDHVTDRLRKMEIEKVQR
jgi:hypothetical protein